MQKIRERLRITLHHSAPKLVSKIGPTPLQVQWMCKLDLKTLSDITWGLSCVFCHSLTHATCLISPGAAFHGWRHGNHFDVKCCERFQCLGRFLVFGLNVFGVYTVFFNIGGKKLHQMKASNVSGYLHKGGIRPSTYYNKPHELQKSLYNKKLLHICGYDIIYEFYAPN